MDAEQFDALGRRLGTTLTRRRSLGVLSALGIAGIGFTDETAAKKHKRRKKRKKPSATTTPAPTTTLSPQCAACTACETCVNATCQPRAVGAACSSTMGNAVCLSHVNGGPNVCADLNGICDHTACNSDADCQSGEACVDTRNAASCTLWFYCSAIVSG
ncbi:MAG: hypothetical protein QM692_08135 [Thermomicrobiales bacterium]